MNSVSPYFMKELKEKGSQKWKDILLSRRRLEDDCWIYTGNIDKRGYGRISLGRYAGGCRVHQLAFAIFANKDEFVAQVNHKNICPNKSCFNPEHLYSGTQAENVKDAMNLGTFDSFGWRRKRCER